MEKKATLICKNKKHPQALYPSHIVIQADACDVIEAVYDIEQALQFPYEVWWEIFGLLTEKTQILYEWMVAEVRNSRKIVYAYYDETPGFMMIDKVHYVKKIKMDSSQTVAIDIQEETIAEKEAILFTEETWKVLLQDYGEKKQMRFVPCLV